MKPDRYSRQSLLAELGTEGQRRLRAGSVGVVGAGGLGSPALLYLAAAGVGRIGVIDPDRVELTNLQRQVMYFEADAGKPKAEAARERLLALNSEIEVEAVVAHLTDLNAQDWVS
ncbi:MAG: ThiF family adenylyltransferase, partial [Bdellovibrionales bacterium]|nr:ThiF family adenylyltransferase [Bdellovibrionales bacterium]